MAAGLGFKTFTTGEVLTAADTNGYLMQGVLVFASAAARDAAITSPQEGQCCYLKDTDAVQTYSGSAWVGFDDSNAIQNSIVDAKGDIVAASGNDTPARLAVGNNGDTLVADSAATTGLRWQGNYAAAKNKIINGDFSINQRSFSSTTSSGVYIYDRFVTRADTGTSTFSAQTFTAGAAPVAGYESTNFLRIDSTGQTATNARTALLQLVEDVRTFAGQTVTFSFWAKAGSGTPSIAAFINQNFGSGGSSAVNINGQKTAITTSWARYSFTFSIPSISGKTIGTGSSLGVWLYTSGGSDYNTQTNSMGIQTATIDVWGIQVEAGSVATAFQTATGTLQGELAACQRYYQKSYAQATAPATNSAAGYIVLKTSSNTIATAEGYGTVFLPVTMRTAPTVTIRPFTTASNTGRVSSGIGTDLAASSGNAVAINETKFSVNNNTGGTLTTAELVVIFHYEASSEL